MAPIELTARVGPNGVLTLNVPVGPDEADREVRVTVRPMERPPAPADREAWKRFVDETAGAWQGEPLTRPTQGEYEVREQWE